MALGWHVLPWRDGDFFETIPDIFTVNLDDLASAEDECKCRWCGSWVESMRRKYAHVFLCARNTENREDFRFYESQCLGWDIRKGHEPPSLWSESDSLLSDGNTNEPGNADKPGNVDESDTTCLYKMGFVVCVGRDEPLGVTTVNNRVHVLAGRDETVFTIRSFSRDDPSSVNFSPGVGAINTDYTSADNWHLAKECLRVCRAEHGRCRHRDGSA
ncbi:hypothetical protein F4801DRAFT_213268 [Xylaria longipes]|nr:hypothetical protein F4801DRAFT_213268 [Xylaria longipes]